MGEVLGEGRGGLEESLIRRLFVINGLTAQELTAADFKQEFHCSCLVRLPPRQPQTPMSPALHPPPTAAPSLPLLLVWTLASATGLETLWSVTDVG